MKINWGKNQLLAAPQVGFVVCYWLSDSGQNWHN